MQTIDSIQVPQTTREIQLNKCFAIWECMSSPNYKTFKAAAAACGIDSFDTALPQNWVNQLNDLGVNNAGFVWDYSGDNRVFGSPVNLHHLFMSEFMDCMQDPYVKAKFVLHVQEYAARYSFAEYVAREDEKQTAKSLGL